MEVIPAINCGDLRCVKEKLEKAADFGGEWVHIDVSDGKFTPVKTWNNPAKISPALKIEVHLMVEKPEDFTEAWLKAGAKRLIIHLESLPGEAGRKNLDLILERCSEGEAEVVLALKPETPAEEIFSYLDEIFMVQLLAVPPGFSGGEFDEATIEKIKVLTERSPDILIEVDGGINPSVAERVKRAGADIIASASYIWESKNPKSAFRELQKI